MNQEGLPVFRPIHVDRTRFQLRSHLLGRLAAGALVLFALGTAADSEAQGRLLAPMANSNAPFLAWHQGFEHGLEGWYGCETDGALGWCGSITGVSARGRKGAKSTMEMAVAKRLCCSPQ